MTDSRSKYMDTRTLVSSPVLSCGWLELQHSNSFPDDMGQITPAAGAHYRVTNAAGQLIEGNLDKNGFASLGNMGYGAVHIEYEPDIDLEIKQLQTEIKTVLNEFITVERQQSKDIENRLNNQQWYTNTGEYVEAGAKGLWNGVTGLAGFIWDAAEGVGEAVQSVSKFAGKYLLDPLNAPETFKKDVAELKKTYKELENFVDEDLETYFILMKDKETWNLLETFASDFFDAQHALEITEGGGEAVFGIILTLVTAGTGSAAAAASSGARLTKLAQKLSAPFKKLVSKLKRRRARHQQKDQSNRRIVTIVVNRVSCFAIGDTLLAGFKKRHPTGETPEGRTLEQEFDRQIKNQQDGINKMSPDDLIGGIDRYDGVRDPAKAKEVRGAYKKHLRQKKIDELTQTTNLSRKEIQLQAKAYANNAAKQMDVLHNPDGFAGGKDQFDVKRLDDHMGDKGVNRSLGTQWTKEERTASLRQEALDAKARGSKKMNTKLKRCGL